MNARILTLSLLSITALTAAAQCTGPLSYTVSIVPGQNLIANQLNCGGNTLNEIMPVVPDSTTIAIFNNATKNYDVATYIDGVGWEPSLTLNPGQGAFLNSPTAFTLTLAGSPNTPVLPVPLPPGSCCILSRQTNGVGTYENIVGTAPPDGAALYQWNAATQSYDIYTYSGGFWSPSVPMADIGEAVAICLPSGGFELCATIPKWSQRPGYLVFTNNPNMHGGNRPSDVDWKLLMQTTNVVQPNWVMADDFRSDGRPIISVRWWGSYFPGFRPGFEDGFILSFFSDVPARQNQFGRFSRPGDLLGTYVAPFSAVRVRDTLFRGWDGHEIYQYEVNLKDTCLEHAVPNVATPHAFLERSNVIYWLAITAEIGHRIIVRTNDDGVASCVAQPSNKQTTNHFWGWHTAPTNWNDVSVMGHLVMPGTNWVYPPELWRPNEPYHMEIDQAFELLTTNPPVCKKLALVIVTNTTGHAASDLHVSFENTGGTLVVDPATIVAPNCAPPTITVSNTTVSFVWSNACVAPDDAVSFIVRTCVDFPNATNIVWTTNGVPIGGGMAEVDPFDPLPLPLLAIKFGSAYIGGEKIRSPVFIINDGLCKAWWEWRLPRWCFTRVYICPNVNRFNRFLELPPWIPVGPWFHSAFSPMQCRYFEDTIRCPELGGRGDFTASGMPPMPMPMGPRPLPPEPQSPRDPPKVPMELGITPVYSDNGGESFRRAADFSSTFFNIHAALTISSNTQDTNAMPPAGFSAFLQEIAPGYAATSRELGQLVAEADEVNRFEPSATLQSIRAALAAMQRAFEGIGAQLRTGRVSDPAPFQAMSASMRDLGRALREIPSPRFANPARNLEQMAVAIDCAATAVAGGLDEPMEISSFIAALYVDLRTGVYHFANGMMPHMRVQLNLGPWGWYPATIDAVEVRIMDKSTGQMLDQELMGGVFAPLSNLGEFDVPLFVEEGRALRLWIKAPSYLSQTVDVEARDGLLIGPLFVVPGDANGDNCVDDLDLQMVQADQGKGKTEFPPSSDVNGNGVVDELDVELVEFNLGMCGESLLAPELGILRSGSEVTLYWPDWATGFRPQVAGSLGETQLWITLTNPPVMTNMVVSGTNTNVWRLTLDWWDLPYTNAYFVPTNLVVFRLVNVLSNYVRQAEHVYSASNSGATPFFERSGELKTPCPRTPTENELWSVERERPIGYSIENTGDCPILVVIYGTPNQEITVRAGDHVIDAHPRAKRVTVLCGERPFTCKVNWAIVW